MTSMDSVLVVAFDGLDKELIEEFNCSTFTEMKEFGGIDNDTDIKYRKTSELFASFITGDTSSDHGISGIQKWEGETIERFESWARQYRLLKKFNGVRETVYKIAGVQRKWPSKDDLKSASVFDNVEDSKALNVPAYNPSPFRIGDAIEMSKRDSENRPPERFWDLMEYQRRSRELLERPKYLYSEFDFLMAHFHRVDIHQHLYGDPETRYDRKKLRKLYRDTDKLAERILEWFDDCFDLIIFMSDHGLPTRFEHNKNAFYSSNREVFGPDTPHITEFHDKIQGCLEYGVDSVGKVRE